MRVEIPLSGKYGKGRVTLVDIEDYERVKDFPWRIATNGYVVIYKAVAPKECKTIYLHREIMQAPDGITIDHINHDLLNNQRSNLRFATHQQNMANKRIFKVGTSLFRGVYFDKSHNKWQAQISWNDHPIKLGRFAQEEDAARAYDSAARDLYGEFATLNFPGGKDG